MSDPRPAGLSKPHDAQETGRMDPRIDRRSALALLGSGVAALAWTTFRPKSSAAVLGPGTTTTLPLGPPRWSRLGLAGAVVLPHDVLLDVDATVTSLRIPAGTRLIFDPLVSHTLTSRGNVVVEGVLETRPASPTVVHDIAFANVNEAAFVGGGMDPIASDPGLWVVGAGIWNAAGTPKTAWTRLAQGATAGARALLLEAAPAGWQPGDRLAITPTVAPSDVNFAVRYDEATVASVSGNTVTLATPLINHHPLTVRGAEVLNLSRNVRLHGSANKRAHVFIRSGRQDIRHVELAYLGPRKNGVVLGRYGLHVHMCGDASRGSIYEGVVIHDAGSHAFVPHMSHGVTFRDCISHNTVEDAYWWDPATPTVPGQPTDDAVFDRCVASLVRFQSPAALRLTGFSLGVGARNVVRNSVAVGVQGGPMPRQRSGFSWREGSQSVWIFEDNVAHNNADSGIFAWQNSRGAHVITRFTGYHNGHVGISHGAYLNHYRYEDSVLYANLRGAIELFAISGFLGEGPLVFRNIVCDGGGLSDYLVVGQGHQPTPQIQTATRFERCAFRRSRRAALGFVLTANGGHPDLVDVIDSTFDGNKLWLGDTVDARDLIRFIDGGTIVSARRKDQAGTFKPEWNARVS